MFSNHSDVLWCSLMNTQKVNIATNLVYNVAQIFLFILSAKALNCPHQLYIFKICFRVNLSSGCFELTFQRCSALWGNLQSKAKLCIDQTLWRRPSHPCLLGLPMSGWRAAKGGSTRTIHRWSQSSCPLWRGKKELSNSMHALCNI